MRYFFLILACTISSISWSIEDDFAYFDKYLMKHERQMTAGKWLLFGGLPLSLLGVISVSVGVTIDNVDTIEKGVASGFTTSGYVFLGVGLVMACIGLPLWIFGANEYYHILERRERYFLMIQ